MIRRPQPYYIETGHNLTKMGTGFERVLQCLAENGKTVSVIHIRRKGFSTVKSFCRSGQISGIRNMSLQQGAPSFHGSLLRGDTEAWKKQPLWTRSVGMAAWRWLETEVLAYAVRESSWPVTTVDVEDLQTPQQVCDLSQALGLPEPSDFSALETRDTGSKTGRLPLFFGRLPTVDEFQASVEALMRWLEPESHDLAMCVLYSGAGNRLV